VANRGSTLALESTTGKAAQRCVSIPVAGLRRWSSAAQLATPQTRWGISSIVIDFSRTLVTTSA
jgi:hypothetical protein